MPSSTATRAAGAGRPLSSSRPAGPNPTPGSGMSPPLTRARFGARVHVDPPGALGRSREPPRPSSGGTLAMRSRPRHRGRSRADGSPGRWRLSGPRCRGAVFGLTSGLVLVDRSRGRRWRRLRRVRRLLPPHLRLPGCGQETFVDLDVPLGEGSQREAARLMEAGRTQRISEMVVGQ
jgi:hypothetical protein